MSGSMSIECAVCQLEKDCGSQVDLWSSHIMHSSCPNIVFHTKSFVFEDELVCHGWIYADQTFTIYCLILLSVRKEVVNPQRIYAHFISRLALVQLWILSGSMLISYHAWLLSKVCCYIQSFVFESEFVCHEWVYEYWMCWQQFNNLLLDLLVSSKKDVESQVDLCSSHIMRGSCPKYVATLRFLYSKTNLSVMGGSMSV